DLNGGHVWQIINYCKYDSDRNSVLTILVPHAAEEKLKDGFLESHSGIYDNGSSVVEACKIAKSVLKLPLGGTYVSNILVNKPFRYDANKLGLLEVLADVTNFDMFSIKRCCASFDSGSK